MGSRLHGMREAWAAVRCVFGFHFWRVTESYGGFIPVRRACVRCPVRQVRRYNGYDSPNGYGDWESDL